MILDIIIVTYILGMVLVGGLFAIATWKIGGFQNYADISTKVSGMKTSSNGVQWGIVILTLFWPFSLYLLALLIKDAKNGS